MRLKENLLKQAFVLFISNLLASCSLGGTKDSDNGLATFNAMPISESVCNSAQFFNSASVTYFNSNNYDSSYCLPYINKLTNYQKVPPTTINKLVKYYYGESATLANTCPAISPQSAVPFPNNSQYSLDMNLVVDKTMSCINTVLPDNNIKKPIFVFDIDDTLISGYIGACSANFSWDPELWNNALSQNALGRVPNMEKILKYAFDNDIDVAFICVRPVSELETAIQNLIAAYPEFTEDFEKIANKNHFILLQPNQSQWSFDVFRNVARHDLVSQGYKIILNMGDQFSDLDYTYPYKDTPNCSYKLPNYMYYLP